jgi:NAD(P)-dependent dehydrogenase (short-subunit alcohol dehydrogenase family)
MRAVVITGSSSGIGRACALALDRLGFQVSAGSSRSEAARRRAWPSSGRRMLVCIDVTDGASITACHARPGGRQGRRRRPCRAEFRRQLEVNLTRHLAVI